MPESQFEAVVFALNIPQGVVSSPPASQGTRTKQLLDWATGPTGNGLDSVMQVLSEYVSLENLGISL
jgi:hypothetical protein